MYMKSLFIRFAICLPALMCLPAYSAAYQMTFEGEVHSTDFKSSGNGISVNSANVTFKNCGIDIADGSTLVVDSGKALFLQENSCLNIDGAAVAITLSDDMQFHTSQFNVLNGASASVNLLNDNLYINQGASLNVDGGSTLTLTFGAGKYVKRVVGETSLTPKAAINVTNNSHLVIQMDEKWIGGILAKLSSNSKQAMVELSDVATWNVDATSSVTLEGAFFDSRYGALTVRGGIDKYVNIGNGEIGLIWATNDSGSTALHVSYKGPLNPYRVLDVSSGDSIGDGTYDSMTGSSGTATVQGHVQILDSINLGEGAVVQLAVAEASISYGGVTVGNKDSSGGAEIRGAGDTRFTIADAVVWVNEDAPAELILTAGLENVLLDNSQSDTKLIAEVGADSLSGIEVDGGEISLVQRVEDVSLSLETLMITNGGSVSVSTTGSSTNTICIGKNGVALFGVGSELNADLTLGGGSRVCFDAVLTMNGQLSLGTGIILTGELLASMESMVQGDELLLIERSGAGLSYAENLNGNAANMYFNNIGAAFRIMADGNRFGLVMASATPAPEPGTGLLSLVALPALAARRRRSLTTSPKQASACREHTA